ncbi:DUF4232 domain-containing protein [Cryobacterium melibiosiphilum]|nr:DUF4232 domain-containing protein [Cryobacterium melibiosiphilum]
MTIAVLAGCAGPAAPGTTAASSAAPTPAPSSTSTPAPAPTSSPAGSNTGSTDTWKIGPNGECDAGQLAFALESRPMDSGMSQFYWNLSMTNTSDTVCTLTGYPQVQLMSSGQGIGAAAGRDTGSGQTEGVVEMPPGASAYSLLHLSQAGVYDCPIVPVTELAVTPPYWDVSRTVATPNEIDGCDDLSTEIVRAGPLTATPRE